MIFYTVVLQTVHLNESVPAVITFVKPLLSVLPKVDNQSGSLGKSHAALVTAVRFYPCVQANVTSKTAIHSECLYAVPKYLYGLFLL